jgi:SAM-dependent methyltransferase
MAKLGKHLGGHLNTTHLDEGALTWATTYFNIKTMIDVGCGPGGMVKLANEKYNIDAVGVDGDFTLTRFNNDYFIIHDFAESEISLDKTFDLGWSVEFVEHVYEKYIPNYMPCFQACKNIIISYAPPGFPGHHHVNCQTESYWIDTFSQYGLDHDPVATEILRELSTMNIDKDTDKQFIKNRGLVFKNKNIIL